MQLEHRFRPQFSAASLIRLGGVGETIAEHDAALRERRQNDFVNMLRARREHQRQFG